MPYRVLQHLSSILGLGFLIYLMFRWYKRNQNTKGFTNYWQAPSALKKFSITILTAVSTIVALLNGYMHLPDTDVLYGMYSAQVFVKYAITGGMGALLLCCFALGILYRLKIKA